MTEIPKIEIKLRELMVQRKIKTIQQLHEKSGLSRKAISKALNNENYKMNIETISKLCAALDCEIGDLLVLKEGENNETR